MTLQELYALAAIQHVTGGARYEGDTNIRNVPTNEAMIPDYSVYRTAPIERQAQLTQEQDRWADPKSFTPEQKATWERTFESDPGWRLLKGYANSWSYAPDEPTSEQYRQGKTAMEDVTEKVEKKVKPKAGTYDPKYVPMRNQNLPARSEPIHFDPSYSQDVAQNSAPPPSIRDVPGGELPLNDIPGPQFNPRKLPSAIPGFNDPYGGGFDPRWSHRDQMLMALIQSLGGMT